MCRTRPYRILLLPLLLLATGCARDYAYRANLEPCPLDGNAPQCENAALVGKADNKLLGFVEFDDQGQLRNPKQMAFVLKTFQEIAGKEDVLLISYVHGWHHTAHYEDSNVEEFGRLLDKARQAEAQAGHRKVLGLYIGWRGDSLLVEGLNMLTFWERKNTAHKVGGNSLVELLLKLEEIVNVRQGMQGERNSRLVITGHSFGGAVVYSALQQILADRFINSRPGQTASYSAKGVGDLVVLVNPAFEALRYSSLFDLSQQRCAYFDEQRPKLTILTSEADWATGIFFPLGRFFSTFFESHHTITDRQICTAQGFQPLTISEGEADRSTVGHFEPYLTHVLHKSSGDQPSSNQTLDIPQLNMAWMAQTQGNQLAFGDTRLEHLGRSHPRNPYLNIRVDKALIADHNAIWGNEILNFLRDFIAISTLPTAASQP